MHSRPTPHATILLATLGVATIARAQIDTLATLVPPRLAAGSDVILPATYDPVSDTAYTTTSILSGSPNGPMLRRITGVSTANPVTTLPL